MVSSNDLAIKGLHRFRDDPQLFFNRALGIPDDYIWDKMSEVMSSVRDNPRTAVKAGHGVSKSYTAGRLAVWFLIAYGPRATVITTAPTHNQVENVLWREIADAHANAKCNLPGKVTATKLDIDDRWFAIGFSTRPDTVTQQATAFQGFHNDHILVIFDEAAGVLPKIWQAADSLLTAGHTRFLAIGNPTSGYGDFVDCFEPESGWNCITISVLDTPNYKQDKEIIPGVSGRRFVNRIRTKYGEKSSYWKSRVLGEIPDTVEGAIFGAELARARTQERIRDSLPKEQAALVHTAWDLGLSTGNAMSIWFFQMVGPEVHIIDYYEEINEGLAHYVRVLDKKKLDNDWIYGKHFAPHDIKQRELSTGKTRLETAHEMGINYDVLELTLIEDGIESSRQIFDRCWFDKSKCKLGLKALAEYHWKRIETVSTDSRPVYGRKPEHDWSSNGADAFRYMAMAIADGRANPIITANNYSEWANYYQTVG